MIHQLRDKRQILKRKKVINNMILAFFVFILFTTGIVFYLNGFFYKIGLPFWRSEKFIMDKIDEFGYIPKSKKTLYEENEYLKKENDDLNISMMDYQIIKKENDDLKEILNRKQIEHNFVLANILSKPNHSPYDTILIDVGVSDGVNNGYMVYANGDIPIGTVEKVEDKTSLISLFTNPGVKTEGIIDNIGSSVELIGRGGGNFEVSLPVELEILEGTKIILPGLKSEIIAIVVGVISKPNDPIKKVILNSPINTQNLKWVEVKTN